MPNRILREGIITSDRVNALDWESEVFYRRLMSKVDDYGRFDARTAVLRAELYPLCLDRMRDSNVQRCLGQCAAAGLVRLYDIRGKQYLELLDFRQQLRAKVSKWPEPPQTASCAADATQMRSTCVASAHLVGVGVGVERREARGAVGDEGAVDSCSEPQAAAEPDPVLTFPCKGEDRQWTLNRGKVAEWEDAFPDMDVAAECRKALQWTRDNPTKRKTSRGMLKFLSGWLSRANDGGKYAKRDAKDADTVECRDFDDDEALAAFGGSGGAA